VKISLLLQYWNHLIAVLMKLLSPKKVQLRYHGGPFHWNRKVTNDPLPAVHGGLPTVAPVANNAVLESIKEKKHPHHVD
jgi:hypothetical protein